MAGVRVIRYVLFALLCVLIIFFVTSSSRTSTTTVQDTVKSTYTGIKEQWNHYTGKSASARERTEKELLQGSSGRTQQSALVPTKDGAKMNATFVTLARNSDLWEIVQSIRAVEDRFNHQFGYDWVFLNDEPFNDEFKKLTSALISGKTKYGLIPKEHWSFPEWIDQDRAAAVRQDMHERKIIYGDSISYRHMCRFESGFFFRQPLMMDYEWYWRVEPSIKLFCDIPYDPFEFMAKNNKMYSFTLSLHEYSETIPTLWNSTKKYIQNHPEHIAEGNSLEFLSDDGGETYNGCHFWSNFEIGNLNFLRSKAYVDYFESLDKDGGFFNERWGDAPIHSIAAGLLLPKEQLHFFNDIAYYHVPFTHCPLDENLRMERKCSCDPKENFDWNGYSCTAKYYDLHSLKKPAEAPLNRTEKIIRIVEWVIFGIVCACVLAYVAYKALLRRWNLVHRGVSSEKTSMLGELDSAQQARQNGSGVMDRWVPSWLMTEMRAIQK